MGFMKKEELLAEAERLGIDISTMKYQDQVAAVAKAQRAEAEGTQIKDAGSFNVPADTDGDLVQAANDVPHVPHASQTVDPVEEKRKRDIEYGRKLWNEVKGKRILIAPIIRPEEANVLFKYDEVLGDDVEVEEVYYDLSTLGNPSGDVNQNGTYRIKNKTGKKVVAQSTIPKENAGLDFIPERDYFTVVTDPVTGRQGYKWKQDVKPMLSKAGYLMEYEDYFDYKKHPENMFYISGWSCCDKQTVDRIFAEINRREQNKKDRGYDGYRG